MDADKISDEPLAEMPELPRHPAEPGSPAAERPSLADTALFESRHRAVVADQRLVFRWRTDGTLTFVTEAFCRYFGRSANDLVGGSLLSLVANTDRQRVRERMERLSVAHPVEMLEYEVVDGSGEARWHVRVDLVLVDEDGAVREVESVARDITEQWRMTSELEHRAALVCAVFESATEGMIAVNRNGEIVLANRRAEIMFGYGPRELLKQPLEILIPDRMRSIHQEHRMRYIDEPRARPMGLGMNLSGRRKDGTEFPIEVSLSFVADRHEPVTVAFVTDISERVQRERHARHVEKLTALGSLAAGIAHEINNPIGIILSRIDLMLLDLESRHESDEVVADLRTLHRQAQRLNRIAETLLTYGRQRPPERQPVDLAAVVNDTLLLARYELSGHRIAASTSFAADVPRVLGDATALQQVFMNMLLNARDAMPEGGTLRIAITSDSSDPAAVRLEVADSGAGIPADVLARLGQPFFTTKSSGTGLGLSVSYAIIREHGGTVQVASEPDRGTTFTITLPGIAER